MSFISLSASHGATKMMIFAEGTILKPKSWLSLYRHVSYAPIGNAVDIIKGWQQQGAEILYCTSRKGKQAEELASLLVAQGFVGSKLYYRERRQTYQELVETVKPDILIEDDCKSIGGSWQMCITHVAPCIKSAITSVVVKEFRGIDHLPHDIQEF